MKQQLNKRQQQQQQHEHRARVVFFGAAGAGKSSLIRRFLSDSFDSGYEPTVEELHRFSCGAATPAASPPAAGEGGPVAAGDPDEGAEFILELLDTAGSYSFPAMRRLAVRSGDAFVLVFSVGDPDSFDEVTRIREEILTEQATLRDELRLSDGRGSAAAADNAEDCVAHAAPRIVVVGAKADREPSSARSVTKEAAACVAELDWGHRYAEASAKDGAGVTELFQELVRMVKGPSRDLRLSAEARRAQFRRQARPQLDRQQRRKEQPKRGETFPKAAETRPAGINKANSCSIC